MGYWGVQSYENDHCFDELIESYDPENMRQVDSSKIVNAALEEWRKKKRSLKAGYYDADDQETEEILIGTTVWSLQHGLKVSTAALIESKKLINRLLCSYDYLSVWNSAIKRKNALKKELKIVNEAINK